MDRLPPIHPGEVLLEDFIKPLGLSQYRVAKDIGVPTLRITQIVRGERPITADTALRLARYFGTSANVWLTEFSINNVHIGLRSQGNSDA